MEDYALEDEVSCVTEADILRVYNKAVTRRDPIVYDELNIPFGCDVCRF